MRLALSAVALAVAAVPAAPASAVTTSAVVHVSRDATHLGVPALVAVPRGDALGVVNAPANQSAYTYLLVNGAYTYRTDDPVTPGGIGTVTVPSSAPTGTYRLTYVGSVTTLASVVVL